MYSRVFLVVASIALVQSANGAVVEQISSGSFLNTWQPSNLFFALTRSGSRLELSDGQTIGTGITEGRGQGLAAFKPTYTVNSQEITFEFVAPDSLENFFFYTQNFSQGEEFYLYLEYEEDLLITAELESSSTKWSGLAKVVAYQSIYTNDVSTIQGAAPVGSYVPFEIHYELQNGSTFNPDLFSSLFRYNISQKLDLTAWVIPEPNSQLLASFGLLIAFLGRIRGNSKKL